MTLEPIPGSPALAGPAEAQMPRMTQAPTPAALRLQILTTEHTSLLASRSLAWNESFARGAMYLSTLSGAMVALGLIAGLKSVGDLFFLFAMVILPVVLFIGFATYIRMGAANYHEALTVIGMNRIRAAYLEIAPDLEPYFVMGVNDDMAGLAKTFAMPPGISPGLHMLAAAPFVVSVLNSVVAGALAAVVLVWAASESAVPTAIVAIAVFALVLVAQERMARSNVQRIEQGHRPMFPPRSEG
jgi:hypothetical protein